MAQRALKSAEAVMPTYDRPTLVSMLKALGGRKVLPFNFPINNQGQYPYCWAFSTVQMAEACLNLAFGDTTVLDPSIGPIVTDSIGEGNSIDAFWTEVAKVYGIPSAAEMGTDPIHSKIINSARGLPDDWKSYAAKRMAIESVECPDFLALASAILNDHPGELGVSWQGGGHAIGCLEIGLQSDGKSLYMATPGTWVRISPAAGAATGRKSPAGTS